MALLSRSRLRFSSSKITPVLSASEAHDRIVYSIREGSAVSSDPLVIPSTTPITALVGNYQPPPGLWLLQEDNEQPWLCCWLHGGANQEVGGYLGTADPRLCGTNTLLVGLWQPVAGCYGILHPEAGEAAGSSPQQSC